MKLYDNLTEKKLMGMNQKNLYGSHLWIKDNNDCLTICRGRMGVAEVESIEGDWSKEEIQAALFMYESTEAAQI